MSSNGLSLAVVLAPLVIAERRVCISLVRGSFLASREVASLEGHLWKPVVLVTIGDDIVDGDIRIGHDVTRLPDTGQRVEQASVVVFGGSCCERIVGVD